MRIAAVPALLAMAACGGAAPQPHDPDPDEHDNSKVFHADDGDDDDDVDDGLEVVGSRGKISTDTVVKTVQPFAGALQSCFLDNVEDQRWLGGKLRFGWELDATGGLVAARVMEGDLGAWPIERCMLDVARSITWPDPGGPVAFDLPFDFDPAVSVKIYDEELSAATVSKRVAELDACDEVAVRPTNVLVTLYLGARGQVQQGGFSSPQVIDDAWADCAHGVVTAWQLTDPKGKVVKVEFWFNPQDIPSEWED